ncbi:MAG: glycoside hydrolase family 5 protein [Chloroflexota bacterium]
MNRLILVVLGAIVVLSAVTIARVTRASPPPVGVGYWHTAGTRILDENGHQVRIAGISWYGMETSYWVPAGLDFQSYTSIMDRVRALGYNSIRLPLSNELIETNPVVTDHVRANPQFRGLHALQVLDAIVLYAQRIGVKLIFDDHISTATRPKQVNYLLEPLWYTANYPETAWIHDWVTLAQRYRGNTAVIGFDLRNEPHTNGPGAWDLEGYLNRGATWGPYQGANNPSTDWRLAAETAGNAILAVNPHLLIFVDGIQLYPDPTAPGGAVAYWWGSNLAPVARYPVVLRVSHQLVYSPHDWGPWKWEMRWFRQMTYDSLQRVWHAKWSYLLDDPNASYAAPIWIGEFGTCTSNPQCVDDQRPGNQATWFHLLLRYLRDHPEIGWTFWALNGTNANDHAANNGLLNPQWNGLANGALQNDLTKIQN